VVFIFYVSDAGSQRRGAAEPCYSVMAPENILWHVVVMGADVLVRGE
jgi:hypothetical protein